MRFSLLHKRNVVVKQNIRSRAYVLIVLAVVCNENTGLPDCPTKCIEGGNKGKIGILDIMDFLCPKIFHRSMDKKSAMALRPPSTPHGVYVDNIQ